MRRLAWIVLFAAACSNTESTNTADLLPPHVDGDNNNRDAAPDLVPVVVLDLATPEDLAPDLFSADLFSADLLPIPCDSPDDCDNGKYCDGVETCDVDHCVAGTPPVVSDGVDCTDDSCDEANDQILHTLNHALCTPSVAGTFCVIDDSAGFVAQMTPFCTLTGCDEALDALDDCLDRDVYPDAYACGANATIELAVFDCFESGATATCAAATSTFQTCTSSTPPSCTGTAGEGTLTWRKDYQPECTDDGTPVCGESFSTDPCDGAPGPSCNGEQYESYRNTCDDSTGCSYEVDTFESCTFDPTYECDGLSGSFVTTYGCSEGVGCSMNTVRVACDPTPVCDGLGQTRDFCFAGSGQCVPVFYTDCAPECGCTGGGGF